MKARTLICMLALAGLVFVGSSTADEKKDPLAGVKCPVSGKPIKEDATVKYKDAKVYFCCQNCPKAFAKNTEKFAAKANHQLVATGQYTQKVCPITGRAMKEDKSAKINGVTVSFCCPGCLGKSKKAEDAVAFAFNDKAFEKGFEKAAAKEDK